MDVKSEYLNLKEEYDDFLVEVKRNIEKLLKNNNIPIAFDILGRTKTLDSIEEKLSSKRFTIKKSITELNDLVGVRIVLLFPEFKEKVVDLLCNKFQLIERIQKKNPVDKFGYNSVHLILGIKEEWAKSLNFENHSLKRIEIQIRTISEHIWAETSHVLFYKKEENIPNAISRDFHRLSALLEIIDENLQNIKNRVQRHFQDVQENDYDEILKMDLNSETFRRVMLKNSNGLYDYEDQRNKELSSRIEKNYNILNAGYFDTLIAGKVDLKGLKSDDFVHQVLYILDEEKKNIDDSQSR
ncbi:RelA/SpoT domain-containing protein [Flavobacterium sp.]|uniref:GTP pyrophosphokinase n=1 Tax=Flavobacterium sp. TaxID=239 RepID=UPI0031D5C5C5